MKLKTATFYQMKALMTSTGIFFAIIVAILGLLHVAIALTSAGGMVNIDNITIKWLDLTFTFVIVTAILSSIRSDFKYFIQNGCSRLTIFTSTNLSYLFISVVSAAIVTLINIPKLRVGTETTFQMLYGNMLLEQFLWTIGFSLMVCGISYLVANISRLLSRKQNLIVGALSSAFVLVVIPSLSIMFPHWKIFQLLLTGLLKFFGEVMAGFSALKAIANFSMVFLSVSAINLFLNKKIQLLD